MDREERKELTGLERNIRSALIYSVSSLPPPESHSLKEWENIRIYLANSIGFSNKYDFNEILEESLEYAQASIDFESEEKKERFLSGCREYIPLFVSNQNKVHLDVDLIYQKAEYEIVAPKEFRRSDWLT